ncbi:MAG: DUF1016 domain-containing protein [Bacteroides sp.]|nr:DUF1016 domain-containing protein [Bacteroides sp.]
MLITPYRSRQATRIHITEGQRAALGTGLYVSAVNHQLKTDHDNPTIGLLICKDKDNIEASA